MMKKLGLLSLLLLFFVLQLSGQNCPAVYQKGDTLFTDPAPRYQWFKSGVPINGANNRWYVPASEGNYSVEISGTTPGMKIDLLNKRIAGRIIDERYEPVSEAKVSAGGKSVLTDKNGSFVLENLPIWGEKAVLTVEKTGFWKNTQRIHFFSPTAHLTAMLEPRRITNRFEAQKGATISERGFFLTFPPNAVVNERGEMYNGTVHLSLKRSFPNEEGFGLRMPGGDFSAIDASGNERMLVSYGFMSAEMHSESGEKLNLANDKAATLEFYIPFDQTPTAPETMPLWHFDETTALWLPEGTARKVGPRYIGTVKHFSSWNIDGPASRATVYGRIVNCEGELQNRFTSFQVNQIHYTSQDSGKFIVFAPADTELMLTTDLDTIRTGPHPMGSETEMRDLKASAMLDAIGVIDSTGRLSVYGQGVDNYSIDNGITFHPKNTVLQLNEGAYPEYGIVRDSFLCNPSRFKIYPKLKASDCQLLNQWELHAKENVFNSVDSALRHPGPVHSFLIHNTGYSDRMALFPCLQAVYLFSLNLGEIPAYLFKMPTIWILGIAGNSLTEVPEEITNLNRLEVLDLSSNHLKAFPSVVTQLPELRYLGLNRNYIPELPENLNSLKKLNSLHLDENQLTGFPETFWELEKLQELSLASNSLQTVPSELGRLKELKWLNLSNNKLTTVPEGIALLNKLQGLALDLNQLSEIPDFVYDKVLLEGLTFGSNHIKSISPKIRQLRKLKRLFLADCQLSEFTVQIVELTDLTDLRLSENSISSIPKNIGNLVNLEVFEIDHNQLTSLPESIGQLTKLEKLNLGNNRLSSLPASIANLKDNLKVLALWGNPISEEEKAKIRAWLPNTTIYF